MYIFVHSFGKHDCAGKNPIQSAPWTGKNQAQGSTVRSDMSGQPPGLQRKGSAGIDHHHPTAESSGRTAGHKAAESWRRSPERGSGFFSEEAREARDAQERAPFTISETFPSPIPESAAGRCCLTCSLRLRLLTVSTPNQWSSISGISRPCIPWYEQGTENACTQTSWCFSFLRTR